MSSKAPDFESQEFDNAETLKEDARLDAIEAYADAQRHTAEHRAFDKAALQFAVNSCLDSCLDSLDLLYIPRESQPISDVARAHDSWRQEEEPEPCSRDSWLRGAILEGPVLTLHNSSSSLPCSSHNAVAPTLVDTSKGSRPLSGASIAQRVAVASTTGTIATVEDEAGPEAAGSSLRGSSISRSSGRAVSTADQVTSASSNAAQPVKDEAPCAAASNSSGTQQKQFAGKQPAQRQHNAEDRLRQELQVRRQQEAVAREMKQKDEQARAALIAMQKELKGKDYTYDTSGKLVLLNKVNPELLPAPPGPQFKVHTATADADAARAASGAKQGSAARNLLGSNSSKSSTIGAAVARSSISSRSVKDRSSKSAAISAADFKQTASQTQPAVLETLRPAAGVVLRAGAAAKQGPKRESQGQTRAQYQQQAKAQNLQAARIVAGNSSSSAGVGTSSAAGNANVRALSATSAVGTASMAGGANGRLTPQQAAAVAASSGRASPALSVAVGATPPPPAATTASERSTPNPGPSQAVAAAIAKSSCSGSAVPAVMKRAPSPDLNVVLVSAADWGMADSSSGYTPPAESMQTVHKPRTKQIREEFGRTTFLPKVRSPTQILKPPRAPPGSTATAGKL